MAQWNTIATTDIVSSPQDTLELSDIQIRNMLEAQVYTKPIGPIVRRLTFNDNTNSIYSFKRNTNSAEDPSFTLQNHINIGEDTTLRNFCVLEIFDIPGLPKAVIGYIVNATSGVSAPPDRVELVAVSTDIEQIKKAKVNNIDTGNYDVNSDFSSFGAN